ncbi:MAG: TonB-dependent receptor [Tannerellaceae bacterium]|nr:TonB-dependent receptor [Tannerellaceae bacterium]
MKSFLMNLLAMLLISGNLVLAQSGPGSISGRIFDAATNEPLEFVNIAVTRKGDSGAVLRGVISDENGNFTIPNLPYAAYQLQISFIGYQTHEQEVTLSANRKSITLPPIYLSEDALMLNEVQVVGMRSQMRFEIDKKVFNVDQDIASTGGSASDILSNIPSVEVDNEGEVSLRGNSSVTIWINGKASGLSADNRAQILEQLPAESIEKIEVITNPSSKYSPEGTAGIINIVLKQDRKGGYYGSAQVGSDSRGGYNASANINYNSGKLDAFASLGFRRREHRRGGYTNRLNFNETDTFFLDQESSGKGNRNNLFTRLGVTYRLAKQDQFSASAFGMFGGGKNNTTTDYLSNIPDSYTSSQRVARSDNDMKGGNIELGYKHDFSENSNIDLTVSYNQWDMDETSIYDQTSLYPGNELFSSYQKQLKDIKAHNWEIQLDYLNKFNENHKIEAGYKGTLNRENSPVETYSGMTGQNAILDQQLYNRFLYDRDVHALYAAYSGKVDNLSFQAGLREEYSNISTRSPEYGQATSEAIPFETDYFSLFPSVFLSYTLPHDNEVQINYTRRISRPWGGQLNPFMNITDSANISFGNPYLSPQYSNAFELNYIKTWEEHMLSMSAYYRTTDDVIQRITFRDGDIMKTTYQNISQTISSGVELVGKNKLFTILDLTTTVNLYYYKLDGFTYQPADASEPVTGEGQNDFSWNIRMLANLKLSKSYTLQLNGNYNSRQVTSQGYRKANYSLDGGIRKSFKDISISLNARDILDSRKWASVTSGTGFEQVSENWWGGHQVGITVTYSFGNMKPKHDNNRRNNNQEGAGGGYEMDGV